MKYHSKTHGCPYRCVNGKCTHKSQFKRNVQKKRLCGYFKAKNCDMYLEWAEMVYDRELQEKSKVAPSMAKLKVSQD